jgi:hypothetical protein
MRNLKMVLVLAILAAVAVGAVEDQGLPKIPRLASDTEEEQPPAGTADLEVMPGLSVTPEFRPRLPVFRAAKVQMDPLFMRAFARVAFGVDLVIPPPNGSTTFAKADKENLVFGFHHCDGLLHVTHVTNGAMEGKAGGATLVHKVTKETAPQVAQEFLAKHHLAYEGAVVQNTLDNVKGAGFYTVCFRRRIHDLPYHVLGDMVDLNITPDGRFASLFIKWSEIFPVGEYPVLTLEEAIKQVKDGKGRELEAEKVEPLRGQITKAWLLYRSNLEDSAYLQPVYIFTVARSGKKGERRVEVQAIRAGYLSDEREKVAEDVPATSPSVPTPQTPKPPEEKPKGKTVSP